MKTAINSPAWDILDQWREGGAHRQVSVSHGGDGWILSAGDYAVAVYPGTGKAQVASACTWCVDAVDLEATAKKLLVLVERDRQHRREIARTRLLAMIDDADERQHLERCSTTERAATDCERDQRPSEGAPVGEGDGL